MHSFQVTTKVLKKSILAILSGLLLGFSFPPFHLYSLAYIAFLPILWIYDSENNQIKKIWYSYIFLLVFNLITLYWVGGFAVGKDLWMMIAGISLIIVHPFFFLPFIWFSFFVKQVTNRITGHIAFIFSWVSFEYLHSLTEFAFPWIILGNSQAYDPFRIQLAEFTSVYGLSFLILLFNCSLYELTRLLILQRENVKRQQVFLLSTFILVIYFFPLVIGFYLTKAIQLNESSEIRVGVVQPNIDPWQKWGEGEPDKQAALLEQLNYHIKESFLLAQQNPHIIFWSETAIPFHIFHPIHNHELNTLKNAVKTTGVSIFSGLPTYELFSKDNAPPTAEQVGSTDLFYQSYNSSVLFYPDLSIGPVYKKIILVPFAERIPYAETFSFLIEPLKWQVGISNWGKGNDTVLYSLTLSDSLVINFSGMICYESVFPQFVREFVRRGAEFLVIVTNDSWWGNTSGAYQHAAYARFRAVETRRWVLQVANGGISLLVNPLGQVMYETKLYETTSFTSTLFPQKQLSFYVIYGNIFAQSCLLICILLLCYVLYLKMLRK